MRQGGFGAASLGRVALSALFATAPRLFYDIEVHGLVRDTGAPHTFFAITHKRDLDAMVPLPALLWHRGWSAITRDVHFAMRSDGFEQGFLARIVLHPRWFSWLLRPISVGAVLRSVGVHPLQDLHLQPAETRLREALRADGDAPAGAILAPAFLAELAAATGAAPAHLAILPISRLLTWRFHALLQAYYGPEIFIGAARRRAERRTVATAKAFLGGIAAWLWEGGSLYNAPEGRLSPDGRLSRITSGLHRVLRAGPPDTRILPVAVVYDFMTVRRPRIFVDLAPSIERAPELPPHELDTRLRAAWLRAARFSTTQLASGYVLGRADQSTGAPFTRAELAASISLQARALAQTGRHVDARLLETGRAEKLAGAFLAYCQHRDLIRRVDPERWESHAAHQPIQVRLGEVGYSVAPLSYAYNELSEMLSV
jgi:hypothetical protein